jgi:hypothetical protein
MNDVFGYFVAIGAGLTTGVALVGLPVYWLVMKLRSRRAKAHADAY